jgi:ABC-2 type transport system ATP-binding protein
MTQIAQTKVKYAIETYGLGKKYHSFWALRDCNITVPMGAVSALVGPNGAGKTTLLKLLVSLNRSSSGSAAVLGRAPTQSTNYLADIGYLPQEIPLYNQFTAQGHFSIGAHLDPHWDNELAMKRLV